MTTRYAIGYAYSTSPRAKELGYYDTGCYYLQGMTLQEDGEWSTPFVVPGTEGEACPTREPHLDALLREFQS